MNGLIPLMSWDWRTGRLELSQTSTDVGKNVQYAALSHVWSDGIGNPRQNAIYTCQAKAIQRDVDMLASTEESISNTRVWFLDTLCIPLANKEARKKGISVMNQIYGSSQLVLVRDKGLMDFETESKYDTLEIMAEIACCKWALRLWTLLEATASSNLFFRFKHVIISSQHLISGSRDIGRSWSTIGDQVFQSSMSMTSGLSRLQQDEALVQRIDLALRAAEGRSTSSKRDELVVIAGIAKFRPEQISLLQEHHGERQTIEFLKIMAYIESEVLMSVDSRLQQPGFRWAPERLTALCTALSANMHRVTDKGLIGKWASVRFRVEDAPQPGVKGVLGALLMDLALKPMLVSSQRFLRISRPQLSLQQAVKICKAEKLAFLWQPAKESLYKLGHLVRVLEDNPISGITSAEYICHASFDPDVRRSYNRASLKAYEILDTKFEPIDNSLWCLT